VTFLHAEHAAGAGDQWGAKGKQAVGAESAHAYHVTRVILSTVATCALVLAFCTGRWTVTSATPTEPALVSVEQAPTQTPSPDAWVHKLPDLSHDPQRQRATCSDDRMMP